MKAIFHRDFNFTSRRVNAGWAVKANPEPQSFPRELIEAAVERGAATLVPSRRKAPQAPPPEPLQPLSDEE